MSTSKRYIPRHTSGHFASEDAVRKEEDLRAREEAIKQREELLLLKEEEVQKRE
jgi:hypothetical protein